MFYDKIIEGKYCDLKSVTVEDAEFTLSLRKDSRIAAFIPPLEISVEQQMEWIRKQQQDPTDYFFVVWDKAQKRIGTLGIYNIKGKIAETGRLAILGNPMQVIEAQLLYEDFAFGTLGITEERNYMYEENERAGKCSKLFGASISEPRLDETGRGVRDVIITKEAYLRNRPKILQMLYRGADCAHEKKDKKTQKSWSRI